MEPLWTPSPEAIAQAQMTRFAERVAHAHGVETSAYRDLWRWSVGHPDAFWSEWWNACGILGERGEVACQPGADIRSASFFPGARLNFAENLLRDPDDRLAILFIGEDGCRRTMTRRELADAAAGVAAGLRAAGVGRGDRVGGIVANTPETVAAMLGTVSIGAVWSACSPDFGADGILDRFSQIEPAALFATTAYFYNGRVIDIRAKLAEVVGRLPGLRTTVVWDYAVSDTGGEGVPGAQEFGAFASRTPDAGGGFEPMGFDDPLYVLFSSGTTGKPKCILHRGGGVLLQHLKEQRLHCDIRPGDRVFYFTTCGWMMWNWLVSALASGAALVLFDGNPMHPDPGRLARLAGEEGLTVFGTSAKYLDAAAKAGVAPLREGNLESLRTVLSTGSPLSVAGFEYVYGSWKRDLHLGSISGGTDICGVFVGGNPVLPVHAGELQCPFLGLDIEVWDETGMPVTGTPGELVCRNAHPTMPIGFWNDPDGEAYRRAYFEPWPEVWRHGDWIVETSRGGYVIEGRSDATLNPGGVRIGTAEIYRQVETLDEVIEALAIGQEWEGDVRIVLFIRLAEGGLLDAGLDRRIRDRIRKGASPRHVPARIVAVTDLPRTRSGKIAEMAVRNVVHGREVKNRTALANPEALELFRDLDVLAR